MGDDAVEVAPVSPETLEATYRLFGFRLKEVSSCPIEFCAYRFSLTGAFEPVRWHKMLASLLATTPRDQAHENELLVALAHELRHSPHLATALRCVTASGWGARKDA
jgi:hypothetical protein